MNRESGTEKAEWNRCHMLPSCHYLSDSPDQCSMVGWGVLACGAPVSMMLQWQGWLAENMAHQACAPACELAPPEQLPG